MESKYQQLSLEDRIQIASLQSQGRTIRQIATALDRSPSTISREIKRNLTSQSGYLPVAAQDKTKARRWTGSMLDRKKPLRQLVLEGLKSRWSPEQIVGRLKAETGKRLISHETIYRFIYAQITRTNNYAWRLYLPRTKASLRKSLLCIRHGPCHHLIPPRFFQSFCNHRVVLGVGIGEPTCEFLGSEALIISFQFSHHQTC